MGDNTSSVRAVTFYELQKGGIKCQEILPNEELRPLYDTVLFGDKGKFLEQGHKLSDLSAIIGFSLFLEKNDVLRFVFENYKEDGCPFLSHFFPPNYEEVKRNNVVFTETFIRYKLSQGASHKSMLRTAFTFKLGTMLRMLIENYGLPEDFDFLIITVMPEEIKRIFFTSIIDRNPRLGKDNDFFHTVCRSGSVGGVKRMMKEGYDIFHIHNKVSGLEIAFNAKSVPLVKFLIKKGMSPRINSLLIPCFLKISNQYGSGDVSFTMFEIFSSFYPDGLPLAPWNLCLKDQVKYLTDEAYKAKYRFSIFLEKFVCDPVGMANLMRMRHLDYEEAIFLICILYREGYLKIGNEENSSQSARFIRIASALNDDCLFLLIKRRYGSSENYITGVSDFLNWKHYLPNFLLSYK